MAPFVWTRAVRLLALCGLCASLGACDAERSLENATRFAARVTCSCVFVSERDLSACVADLPEDAARLDLSVDQPGRRVLASVLWVEAEARFDEGRGCKLQD